MQKFRVVTVAREYGSGGGPIARKLADRLGWDLLDNALITRIARAANIDRRVCEHFDEAVDSWMQRLTKVFRRGTFEAVGQPGLFDSDAMAARCRQVIEEAARLGNCVIVGRGGQCILQAQPGVFHVYLYAPMEERVRRVRDAFGPEHATPENISASDRDRLAYVKHHYHCDRANPHLYDAMFTSMLGDETVVNAILAAMDLNPVKVSEDAVAQRT